MLVASQLFVFYLGLIDRIIFSWSSFIKKYWSQDSKRFDRASVHHHEIRPPTTAEAGKCNILLQPPKYLPINYKFIYMTSGQWSLDSEALMFNTYALENCFFVCEIDAHIDLSWLAIQS